MPRWLAELQAELPPSPQTVLILVGSKLDRASEREVAAEEGSELARAHRGEHLECSSKDGTNVDAVFERVTRSSRRNP